MIKKIKWVSSPHNKFKNIGAQQPIKPSDYFKALCDIGAGFKR